MARLARAGELTFLPERIGSWWDRSGEVDVVVVSQADGAMLLGECKWSVNPVGTDILDDLQRKVRLVDPQGRWPAVSYALFAKAGFTPALIERATVENVRLVGSEALVMGDDFLENDPHFLARIAQARETYRAGSGVRIEDVLLDE